MFQFNEGDKDALTMSKAKRNGEPVFVLRARDSCSTETLAKWIALCKESGVVQAKITDAESDLARFVEWQDTHQDECRLPD